MSFGSSLGRGKDMDGRRGAHGCREAGGGRRPTASARGGRQWPSHHGVAARAWVHAVQDTRLLDAGWLTSGPNSISYFKSFSITQTLKFELVSFPMNKILQIL
jgi:hypothetical protein